MAEVLSRYSNYTVDLKFHILSELKPILPSNRSSVSNWSIPETIRLADPKFDEPNRIDVIIGAEVYYQLLLEGFVELGPSLPILKETVFGWIVSGKCTSPSNQLVSTTMVCCHTELEKQMSRFWELESCHSDSTLSEEERQCEAYFSETTSRDSNGRFVVSLPKKKSILVNLGDSHAIALRRFLSLERRLHGKPALWRPTPPSFESIMS